MEETISEIEKLLAEAYAKTMRLRTLVTMNQVKTKLEGPPAPNQSINAHAPPINPTEENSATTRCGVCKKAHSVYECRQLLQKKDARARTELMSKLRLCWKCLTRHPGNCENQCQWCRGPHHLLLCFRYENQNLLNMANPEMQMELRNPPTNSPTNSPTNVEHVGSATNL